MNAPELTAQRFLIACLLGCALGIYYGFLRPLRRRWTGFSDLLFLPGLFGAWIYLGFGVCDGDLRFGYTVGLLLGCIGWNSTVGPLLVPFFDWIWRPGVIIFKKIRKILKFLYATGKKWGTIYRNNRQKNRRRPGGVPNGKQKKSPGPNSAGVSAGIAPAQVRGAGSHRIVYGSNADPAGIYPSAAADRR